MRHEIDFDVAIEICSHEAIVRQAYKDSVGKWTWSVGLTSATGHNVERYIDNPQTMKHCLDIYIWALEDYADAVREAFDGHDLTKAQFTSALSFEWNTGKIKKATWVKDYKAGQIAKARASFMNWKSPPEIIPRRKKERDLFFDGKWCNNGTVTEYTKLKQNHTPDWGSGKKVDIREDLQSILGGAIPPPPDIEPVETPKTPTWFEKIRGFF